MEKKSNKIMILALVVILIGLAIAMWFIYQNAKPDTQAGSKTIVVEVVIPDEESKEFTINTDAEYLRQALDEKGLIDGNESTYGFYITAVNSRVANEANQEWWCITKSKEELLYGVNEIPVSDGDHFEITLTVGYGQ